MTLVFLTMTTFLYQSSQCANHEIPYSTSQTPLRMSHNSLKTAYTTLLTRQRLTPNPSQLALVNRLNTLQTDLYNHHLSTSNSKSKLKYSSQPSLNGLYIYGSVGTGKSRIADLFASTLPPCITHRRMHFYEFMMDIHSRLHTAHSLPTYTGDPLLQIGRDVRAESQVLCFDEFQVTDIADALILKRLFGAIWESGGVMVSTSNRPPEDLYEKGLNRELFLPFVGELRRNCEVWEVEGKEDYRMSGRGQGRVNVFFTNEKDFGSSLKSAIEDVEMKEKIIPVIMSRKLTVLAAESRNSRGLVVSSTFEDLCQHFLGSADYYALCKATNVLYLTGLRKFASDELDFVRRFITLVDLAYETKTRIICLSSAPLFEIFSNIVPKKLYVEGMRKEELGRRMKVKGEGGSSSSMMSTFIDGETEWSATGLREASLATGGAGETDVGFAVGRAVSRLYEMGSRGYGVSD
ncbi:AFG1-like ATPase-domain-containing protein [Cadophora sp. MPI-SDFR-AT-0126]|nr:AFG1-like ATPase-domain-containing protein [Leotiomycetes sp. MPI-SDFR-AT-0126]